ncbi:MAG: hypothetical protein HFJ09_05205 [Lachnospiraceae bacterium]|nr:hypothetical protein [Lachnospiraceae bacterium]
MIIYVVKAGDKVAAYEWKCGIYRWIMEKADSKSAFSPVYTKSNKAKS